MEQPAPVAASSAKKAKSHDMCVMLISMANNVLQASMPVINHPEIPADHLKRLWQISQEETEALAEPIARYIDKMPAAKRGKLEQNMPALALAYSLFAVYGTRINETIKIAQFSKPQSRQSAPERGERAADPTPEVDRKTGDRGANPARSGIIFAAD